VKLINQPGPAGSPWRPPPLTVRYRREAGVAALLLAANLSSAAPNMAGDYFLYAIAAVLLGMTMFEPGRPNIPGTVFAALVLKVLGNGLVLLGTAYYVQDIVLGAIIIGSVAFSASVLKKAAFRV